MGLVARADVSGLDVHRTVALTALTSVKNARASLYGVEIYNAGVAEVFLHLYDASSTGAVTVGTTVPQITYWVPATTGKDKVYPTPISFELGLQVAATTTVGGAVAPGTGVFVQLEYK